jgi:peptidoglycan/LPS O-acetylase OafA/YrhL
LPLFFFISGFFAEMMCETRGVDEFLKHRIRRIAIPYHVCLVTLMPLTLAIWICGLFISGRCTLGQVFSLTVPFDPEVQNQYFGPGHLWFLADLVIISVAFGLLRREFPSGRAVRPPGAIKLRPHPFAPLCLAVPSFLLLWGNPSPFVAHNNSFIPDTARLSYYALYFITGAIAFRRKEEFLAMAQYPSLHLPVSLVAAAAMIALLPNELSGASTFFTRLLLSASVSLAAWLSIFGLLGVFLRNWKNNRPAFRYLADASYWIYIVHLPLVGLSHIALRNVMLGALPKFILTSVITSSVAVLSYQTCVRYTWIGRALHGARHRDTREFECQRPGASDSSLATVRENVRPSQKPSRAA